jgi:hypothetical protein
MSPKPTNPIRKVISLTVLCGIAGATNYKFKLPTDRQETPIRLAGTGIHFARTGGQTGDSVGLRTEMHRYLSWAIELAVAG